MKPSQIQTHQPPLDQFGSQVVKAGKHTDETADPARHCSFSGDTPVLMADGTTKKFADLKPGDKVLATDPETGEQGSRTIEKVLSHDDDPYVLTVNGQRLTTAEDRPFRNEADARSSRRLTRVPLQGRACRPTR